MNIIYDDNDLTVCIKEAGILSEASDTKENIISLLNDIYKERGQSSIAYPIHRLDAGVGGIMVYAKNSAAASELSRLTREGNLGKEYLAVIIGSPQSDFGVYEDLLFKDSKKNKSFVVDRMRSGVREAKLEYSLIESAIFEEKTLSLVKIKLYTGRSHQIRVQFSSRKTPLFGDRKYGASLGKEIALWSYKLSFIHPTSKEKLEFSLSPHGGIWDLFDI